MLQRSTIHSRPSLRSRSAPRAAVIRAAVICAAALCAALAGCRGPLLASRHDMCCSPVQGHFPRLASRGGGTCGCDEGDGGDSCVGGCGIHRDGRFGHRLLSPILHAIAGPFTPHAIVDPYQSAVLPPHSKFHPVPTRPVFAPLPDGPLFSPAAAGFMLPSDPALEAPSVEQPSSRAPADF